MQRANEEGEALLRHAPFVPLPGHPPRRSDDAASGWARGGMLVTRPGEPTPRPAKTLS